MPICVGQCCQIYNLCQKQGQVSALLAHMTYDLPCISLWLYSTCPTIIALAKKKITQCSQTKKGVYTTLSHWLGIGHEYLENGPQKWIKLFAPLTLKIQAGCNPKVCSCQIHFWWLRFQTQFSAKAQICNAI